MQAKPPRRGCILLPSNPGHILSYFQILNWRQNARHFQLHPTKGKPSHEESQQSQSLWRGELGGAVEGIGVPVEAS